jgi:hypothetical protein
MEVGGNEYLGNPLVGNPQPSDDGFPMDAAVGCIMPLPQALFTLGLRALTWAVTLKIRDWIEMNYGGVQVHFVRAWLVSPKDF